jgi:hypothetical protein
MRTTEKITDQTERWIKDVVVGCNFCPFAAKPLLKKSIRYIVLNDTSKQEVIETLQKELEYLDANIETETTFIITPTNFDHFIDYLDIVNKADDLIVEKNWEGIYQIASFHPLYLFENANEDDAENYTNRSPYPMLHILREESVTKVVDKMLDPNAIPENNIHFAKTKGLNYMQALRQSCFD